MEQILNTDAVVLQKGTAATVSIGQRDDNFPLLLSFDSGLIAAVNGSCGGSVSEAVFPSDVYQIPQNATSHTFTQTVKNKCSQIAATLSCTVQNGSLVCLYDYAYSGQSFIEGSVSGNLTLTKVYQDIPSYTLTYPACPTGYTYAITRTASSFADTGVIVNSPSTGGSATIFPGDTLTMSAAANFGYNAPTFGLGAVGTTTKTDISGNITAVVNSAGAIQYPIQLQAASGTTVSLQTFLYPAHPSFDCDGGCYCYCKDGSQVADGEDCPDIYGDYNKNYICAGDSIWVRVSLAADKFLDEVVIGNKSYKSVFFNITANGDTLKDGKLTIITKTQSARWRTVNSQTHTFSGSTENIVKTVSGIKAGRQTRITAEGYYSSEYYSPGSTPPEYCDGGCYCYCADGTQIADGELCGSWKTGYTTITAGLHTSDGAGALIPLSINGSLANATVSIADNQLTFNGTRGGNSPRKYLTITKVEQFF